MLDSDVPPRSAEVVAFQKKASSLQRAMLGASALAGELSSRVQALERAILATPGADAALASQARALVEKVRVAQMALTGDQTLSRYNEPTPPSLMGRMNTMAGWSRMMGAPTATQERQYEILSSELGGALATLRTLAQTDLPRVEKAADDAGVPWTTGRIPEWNQ
jgi:hypothetical protein